MNDSVLIVGYGRFGRAIADLLTEGGYRVWARDPHVPIPADLVPTADALAGVSLVLICVPVAFVESVLRELRPILRPDQLVIDASSVRAPADDAMNRVLGSDIPWVGTHPLFGPSSLAMGERPLQVVVCPNAQHPTAAGRARALYVSLGCDVIEEDAEAHDRSMAYSHALAFFLAKGLLDIDATERTLFIPPSYRAILGTVDAVRSDAGHLFFAIENLNPFSPDARRELLAALERLDEELRQAAVDDTPDAAADFVIPDLGEAAPELREVRDVIDDLDQRLVHLIAQRTAVAARAGRAKGEHDLPVRDPTREREVLRERRAWASEAGLDDDAVGRLFEELMALARGVQERGD